MAQSAVSKIIGIIVRRLRTQGVSGTLVWLVARGLPIVTGIPLINYSRIAEGLYVGGQYGLAGKRKLEQLGVVYGVNLRNEFDDATHGLALPHYLYLPTEDDDAPTLEQLMRGVAFIHNARSNGGQVYIHCAGGVGRAPTLAAAYLISQGMGVEGALAFIRQTRPFIMVTPVQVAQLERFARAV